MCDLTTIYPSPLSSAVRKLRSSSDETFTIFLLLLLLLLLLFLHDLCQASSWWKAASQLLKSSHCTTHHLYTRGPLQNQNHTWTLLPNSSRALLPGSSAPSIHTLRRLLRSIYTTPTSTYTISKPCTPICGSGLTHYQPSIIYGVLDG